MDHDLPLQLHRLLFHTALCSGEEEGSIMLAVFILQIKVSHTSTHFYYSFAHRHLCMSILYVIVYKLGMEKNMHI